MIERYYIVLRKGMDFGGVKTHLVKPSKYSFKNKLALKLWEHTMKKDGYAVLGTYKGNLMNENTILNLLKSYEWWDEI